MSKKLIITEKPSVARDFAKVLGVKGSQNGYIENNEYVITWCVGHLVGMLYPEAYDPKYEKWKLEDLPFLPTEYKYGVLKPVEQQYNTVHSLLHREDIETVYWAGDSGKEGQTIEENIRNYGGVREGMKELRVWIDSQTDEEIRRGINEAKDMNEYANLGKSGIMRTIEDYALGINFSRVLSVKYGRLINDAAATNKYTAIAVGRVMSCVLGMVVFREREIRDFVETPFYRVIANVTDNNILAEWKAVEQSKYYNSPLLYKENGFKKLESAENLIEELKDKSCVIDSIENNTSKKKAPLLFNLAEIQAECAKRFKITPEQTLNTVQDLYERKLTTYPRTDARVLTTAIAKEISKNLYKLKDYEPTAKFTENILNNKLYQNIAKTSYTDDSKVTDHYAIIPTGQTKELNGLSDIHKKVYDLIVRRFLSIFYPPAEYQIVKIIVDINGEKFFSNTKLLKEKGYMEIAGVVKSNDDDEAEQSEDNKKKILELSKTLNKGDVISLNGFDIKEGKTSPPKRYTEGTIILAMENAGNLIEDEELREQIKNTGIGTSATRAQILSKLIDIGYLNENKKTLILTPSALGEMIFEVIYLTVPTLLNPEMTASWEKGLEGIINGTVDAGEYRRKLEEYITVETNKMIGRDLSNDLVIKINKFTTKESRGAAARKPIGAKCPKCGGEITTTTFGYGCLNYWDKDNKCDFSIGKIAGVDLSEESVKQLITTGETDVISGFVSGKKKKFDASLKMTKGEDGNILITFDFSKVSPKILEGAKCPVCNGDILIKSFGYGCANYNAEDNNSCKFSIGKIAGKDLKEADVIELINNGRTATIRGFKSKNNKKFDACLKLNKDEAGKVTGIGFDFDNVEVITLEGVVCPGCGGKIEKTSYGYKCEHYNKDDEAACKFLIGKIAGKDLKEADVIDLINNGITNTIRGFKSKNNKKFDACLKLNKDDNGKITGIDFDFENVQELVIKDCVCPNCKGDIVKTGYGYKCINYDSKAEDACKFVIGKIAGRDLKESDVIELINNGITGTITGFKSKNNKKFDACLKLSRTEDGIVTGVAFDFDNVKDEELPDVNCPNCNGKILKTKFGYKCENYKQGNDNDCNFSIGSILGHDFTDSEIVKLLKDGKTEKITGFVSKNGKDFDAQIILKRDENEKVTGLGFEF